MAHKLVLVVNMYELICVLILLTNGQWQFWNDLRIAVRPALFIVE